MSSDIKLWEKSEIQATREIKSDFGLATSAITNVLQKQT